MAALPVSGFVGEPPRLAALPPLRTLAGREGAFERFAPVSLAEMESVALLERRDTKYVLSEGRLAAILSDLAMDYRVLEIRGNRLHNYRTCYFDTADLSLFRAHHNARPSRYKVRSRLYVDSQLAFFEVKARDARNHTRKSRTATLEMVTCVSPEEAAFLESHAPYPMGELAPRLLNSFSRATLVDRARGERLTLDFGLTFAANGEVAGLPGLVVAELKQPRAGRASPFGELMRASNIHPASFSKYCVGVSLLYPGVKHNRFNSQLRRARRITGESHVE